MRELLDALWVPGTYGELRMIRRGEVEQSFYHYPSQVMPLLIDALKMDDDGWDVYIGVLNRTTVLGGTKDDCVSQTHVLWADVDGKHFDGNKAGALFSLARANLEPSILVDSGNGWHAYWLLTKPVQFELAQSVMKGLAKAIGGDSVFDAARILRLPGTRNYKTDPPKPVRLIRFEPTRQYRFSDFLDYEETEPAKEPWFIVAHTPEHGQWEPSNDKAPKFPDGSRNNMLTSLAGAMVAKGLSYYETVVWLVHENKMRCDPPLPDHEVEMIAKSVQRYARE